MLPDLLDGGKVSRANTLTARELGVIPRPPVVLQ
jgi:hypothetical protein